MDYWVWTRCWIKISKYILWIPCYYLPVTTNKSKLFPKYTKSKFKIVSWAKNGQFHRKNEVYVKIVNIKCHFLSCFWKKKRFWFGLIFQVVNFDHVYLSDKIYFLRIEFCRILEEGKRQFLGPVVHKPQYAGSWLSRKYTKIYNNEIIQRLDIFLFKYSGIFSSPESSLRILYRMFFKTDVVDTKLAIFAWK